MYLLFLILSLAVLSDFSIGRIPNMLTYGGLILSQIWVCSTSSVHTGILSMAQVILLILMLFPFFSIGCLGGGDIKLLIIFPGFIGFKGTVNVLWVSLVLAGCIGVVKLVRYRELKSRLYNLVLYLRNMAESGKVVRYSSVKRNGIVTHGQIRLSLPILVATMVLYIS